MHEAAARSGLPGPGEGHVLNRRGGEPFIVTYKSGVPKIDRSIADAHAHIDYSGSTSRPLRRTRRPSHSRSPSRSSAAGQKGREHIWVTEVKRNGATLTGRLDNDPDMLKGVKSGDSVTFSEGMVTDWGFARHGRLIGFYSTRAMLDDAPPEEAEMIRKMLGENPA
jgi:uncharacterized protein YegJ (DUF2314 family)